MNALGSRKKIAQVHKIQNQTSNEGAGANRSASPVFKNTPASLSKKAKDLLVLQKDPSLRSGRQSSDSAQQSSHFQQPRSLGFTLVEVMIAMAIMSSSIVLMSQTWSSNWVRVRKIGVNNRAAFLLNSKMAELETLYSKQFNNVPEEESGEFEEYPEFSWSMKSQKFSMPDLRSLLITGGEAPEQLVSLVEKLTEFFNETVIEMQVTITYTRNKAKSKKTFRATTFLVDFDRPLPLPNIGGF